MNLFRSLLFWIVLALVGALVAQLLAQDPGLVVVSYNDWTYEKSLAYSLVLVLVGVLAVWLVWKLLTTPFVMLRRRRKKAARARLIEGLEASHLGHWSRAGMPRSRSSTWTHWPRAIPPHVPSRRPSWRWPTAVQLTR